MTTKFSQSELNSKDGMSTRVWGPALWHFLHTMSVNYPPRPTEKDKRNHLLFLQSLSKVLPCRNCRENFPSNLEQINFNIDDFENRDTFSNMIFRLHNCVNNSLQKQNDMTYSEMRDRYENFRARCSAKSKDKSGVHKGCTNQNYGNKKQCVVSVVPLKSCSDERIRVHEQCLRK